MVSTAARLSPSPLSAAVRKHPADQTFSEYYRQFLKESGFKGPREIAPDAMREYFAGDEVALGDNILGLEAQLHSMSSAPVSRYKIVQALFSACQLATYGAHLELAAADEQAGEAAACLAWVEAAMPEDPAVPFFRGWIFYLAGDVPEAERSLAEVKGDPWKMRAAALGAYIRNDEAGLEKVRTDQEPWIGILHAMVLEKNGMDEKAILAYKNAYESNENNLLPLVAINHLIELGNPEVSKHEATDTAWRRVLDSISPQEPTVAGKYRQLTALAAPDAVLTPAVRDLFLGYFRHALYHRHEFIRNILGSDRWHEEFMEELSGEFRDPILDFFQALKEVRQSNLTTAIETFKKVDAGVKDPYLRQRFIGGLPEKFGAPLVNEVQDHPYESWRYYRQAGFLCRHYAWNKKAGNYFSRSLARNPYQGDLKDDLREFEQMESGQARPFDPEHDPFLGTSAAFSVWSPEVDRAMKYLKENPAYLPSVFEFVERMELRGDYEDAIALGRRALEQWPENIGAANLSAKIGWIYLRRLGDVGTAKEQFERMEWFGNGSNLLGLAECCEKTGQIKEAEERYQDNEERYNEHFPLAAFYVRRGRMDRALESLGGPENYSGANARREFFTQAMTFYVNESYPTLVQMIYEKIVPDRKSWISYDYSQWALSYLVIGNYGRVNEILDEAKREGKTNPFMDYFRYAIACKQKNWPAATLAISSTTGDYYHKFLPGAMTSWKDRAELEKYARDKPMYQSYLSSMYGLLAYRHLAYGEKEKADELFKLDAGSIHYATWHIPILASHEIGERVPVTGPK